MKCTRCNGEGRITIEITIVDKKNKQSTTQSQANVICPNCVGTGNEQPKNKQR
jgi:RecJ-like exonuclease